MLCFHNQVSCPFLSEKTTNEAQNQLWVPSEGSVCAVPLRNLSFQSKHYSAWYSLTWPVFAFPRCLLQHFQANSHLIFPTESPNTLPTHTPEKRGRNGAVVDPSRLSKDFNCKCRFFFFLLPTHIFKKKKKMSREIVLTFFYLLVLYFSLIECVSPLWIDLIPHKRWSSFGVSLWETCVT